MSISFTQSMQALHADHGRAALWGIAIALLFLCLWLLWFLTPSLTIYAHGQLTKLTRSGTLVAEVAAQESTYLQAGQVAYLYPAGASTTNAGLRATVLEVITNDKSNQVQITLYPDDNSDLAAQFGKGITGEVEVAVQTISPALLLWQTLNNWQGTSAVTLHPQRAARTA